MTSYRVYRPTFDPEPPTDVPTLTPRPDSLSGKRIGLLWNSKVNADIYLRRTAELIEARYEGVEFVWRAKPTASKPMEPDVLADMSACDLVVTAFGD